MTCLCSLVSSNSLVVFISSLSSLPLYSSLSKHTDLFHSSLNTPRPSMLICLNTYHSFCLACPFFLVNSYLHLPPTPPPPPTAPFLKASDLIFEAFSILLGKASVNLVFPNFSISIPGRACITWSFLAFHIPISLHHACSFYAKKKKKVSWVASWEKKE